MRCPPPGGRCIASYSQTLFTCNSHTTTGRGFASSRDGTSATITRGGTTTHRYLRLRINLSRSINQQYEPPSDFVDFTSAPPVGPLGLSLEILSSGVKGRNITSSPQRGRLEGSLTTDIPRTKLFHGDRASSRSSHSQL